MMRRVLLVLATALLAIPLALAGSGQAHALNFYENPIDIGFPNHCMTGWTAPVNPSPVFIYQCYGNPNQGWIEVGVGGGYVEYTYEILDANNGRVMCLDAPSGGKGYSLTLWDCNGSTEQKFAKTQFGSNRCNIVNYNGLAVALDSGNVTNYWPIIEWTDEGNVGFEVWHLC